METSIEKLFQEKISLYRGLLEIMEEERKSLSKTDVESLWLLSEKKKKAAREIEELRNKILDTLTRMGVDHDMDKERFSASKILDLVPIEVRKTLNYVRPDLFQLKEEIHNLTSENKKFVEDYLLVLDDMIGIITDAGKPQALYEKNMMARGREKTNLLICKEV